MRDPIDDIYIKTFNQAYLLANYNIVMIEKIIASKNDGRYFEGLRDGKLTFEKEQKRNRLNDLKRINPGRNKNLDLDY